ncbi:hypothetical protein ADIS_0037 [Lunatimonas lonarensis]|uniref:Uncharacterized protein n=1 Tax=Lunatimonas lonarensis TaxID=1232681 RepID=R7ZZF1_9BACT|nr:hypothetical protein [Lunatimonas lonarensis]EON79470.1 hypothetical protein ADIS_0037 [Lunatimonas lonarensis]
MIKQLYEIESAYRTGRLNLEVTHWDDHFYVTCLPEGRRPDEPGLSCDL